MPPASISIRFSEECWRFLRETMPELTPLDAEVHVILDRAPRIDDPSSDSERRSVVKLRRAEVNDLLGALTVLHDALPRNDARRGICRQCRNEIVDALPGRSDQRGR